MQVVTLMEKQFENSQRNRLDNLVAVWRWQLKFDYPDRSVAIRDSIINWLLETDRERLEQLDLAQFQLVQQNIEYRYRILKNRYLGQTPQQAYRRLLSRLGSLVLMQKTRTLVTLSRDYQRQVMKVLPEVLQLLQRERYVQQQIAIIAKCTPDANLRSALLFASLEEYCLQPVGNQPLIVYRAIDYLSHLSEKITSVPNVMRFAHQPTLDSDSALSLYDPQTIAQYRQQRQEAKQRLSKYLEQQLGSLAVKWLDLYLQGQTQQAIACQLQIATLEVYRLQEKVSYHAARLFRK